MVCELHIHHHDLFRPLGVSSLDQTWILILWLICVLYKVTSYQDVGVQILLEYMMFKLELIPILLTFMRLECLLWLYIFMLSINSASNRYLQFN